MSLIERALLAAHLFSAAAWFGALVYRTFFVDPRSRRYFARGGDFETYSLHLSDGMRYVVLLALLASGLSGFVLMGLRWNPDAAWQARMAVKAGLWALALAVFAYVSWVYWPRRVFATQAEWSGIRTQGLALSLVMIAIAALGMLLGQWGRG
jgi:putative copper export protein